MANTTEELIKQMYGANLESQKQQLTQNHNAGNAALDEAKKQNQAAADANLNRTAVEAQKRAMSDAETQNASGLSSGAAAQVHLARDNQTAADMAAIRTAQQEADAQVERERALLSQEYTAAIQKAQADNDLELAKALYENAQAEEEKLLAKKEAAANAMAGVGDYSLMGQLYGLSDAEVAKLTAARDAEAEKARFEEELSAAKYMANQTGDFSQVDAVYAKYLGGAFTERVSESNYTSLMNKYTSGYSAANVDAWLDEIDALVEKGQLTMEHAIALQDKIKELAAQGGPGPGAVNSQVATPWTSGKNLPGWVFQTNK